MLCIFTEPDQLSKLADKISTLKIPSFDWWFWKKAGRRKWDGQERQEPLQLILLARNVSLNLVSAKIHFFQGKSGL